MFYRVLSTGDNEMATKEEVSKPQQHILVPKHEKLSEKEKKELLEKHSISFEQLPRIFANDPAVRGMNIKTGDVVKITRQSMTAGHTVYYRGAIGE